MKIPKKIEDFKWDIKKDRAIYSNIYTHRLIQWILIGRIKKDEVMVWRGGLSGWVKPETLPELIPYFEHWESAQSKKRRGKAYIKRKKAVKTILVIDDEEDTCTLLKRLLERRHEVSTVTTARAGINFVKKEKPDMVLLDLKLKDMDGLSVLSRIKKASPGTIVIIISAYGDENIKKEARHFGVFGFLDKPLFKGKVYNIIRSAGH